MFNRRHLEEHLARLADDARRSGLPLAVVLIDVDRFKQVNDTHGHAGGDVVLRRVADRLRRSTRSSEIVGRWGGEEFLLLLPHTTSAEAATTAERVRLDIAEDLIDLDGETISVTISAGCAAGPRDDVTTLVNRADAALYRAKASGRDRVEVATE